MADIKKVIEVFVKTKEAKTDVESLNKSLKETKDISTEVTQETGSMSKSFTGFGDVIDNVSGGAVSSFKGMASGVKGLSVGFKGLRGAIIATGLGALVVIVISIITYFTKFDKGVRLVSQAMSGLEGFVTGIINNFQKLLSLDLVGFFKGVGSSIQDNVEATGRLIDATRELQELNTKQTVDNANLNAELQKQKKILEDTTLSFDERRKAQEKINQVTTKLLNNEKEAIILQRDIAQQNLKSASTEQELRDAKQQVAEVEADLIKITSDLSIERQEAAKKLREVDLQEASQKATLAKEEKARKDQAAKENQARIAQSIKEREEELAREEARLKKLTDLEASFTRQIEDLKATTASERIELQRTRALEEVNNLKATEEEKIAVIKALNEKFDLEESQLRDIKAEEERVKEEERLRSLEELRRDIQQQIEDENAATAFEKEELRLEREKERILLEMENLQATEEEKAAIIARYEAQIEKNKDAAVDHEKARQKALFNAKVGMALETAGAITSVLGEESGAAKGVAIAQALWNTYQGISAGVAMGIPAGIPSIIAAGAMGFKAVKDITSTKVNKGGGGSGGSTGGGGRTPSPNYNVVSDNKDTVMDEIDSKIKNEPQKAYVVGSEVSTQQALDRNRINNSKFI